MKVLVCGSRAFAIDGDTGDGKSIVWAYLDELAERNDDLHLISGGAGGPDSWAQEWAEQSKVNYSVYFADWERHGRRAGIIRNGLMLNQRPDLVSAFWDGESTGTKNTIDGARLRGIPVEVIEA